MEKMNALTLIITLVVGVILTGALLGPVISDATETERTYTNEGYYTMDAATETMERIIVWEKASPDVITIDGVEFSLGFAEINKSYTLIGSDSFIIRYQKDNTNTGIQAFINPNTYVSMHTGSSADLGDTVTLTISEGSVTFTSNGTTPINRAVGTVGDNCYVINAAGNGEYSMVMKKANTPAYLLGNSNILFMGVSVAGGPSGIAIYGTGSIDDGMELDTIYTTTTTTDVSYSDPAPTSAAVNGYKDLYSLDKYNFTISYTDNGTPKTFDATYSYFIVPATVTAERIAHLNSAEIAIMGAIPIMVIVALLMVAVGAIAYRRAD